MSDAESMTSTTALRTAELRSPLLAGVAKSVAEFQAQPYRFLYESDIQAQLAANLRSTIATTIAVPAPGSRTAAKDRYVVDCVNTEYLERIDVVCLDPDRAAAGGKLSTYGIEDVGLYSLPLFAGIELKYRKMGDKLTVWDCKDDWRKLEWIQQKYSWPTHILTLGFVQRQDQLEPFLAGSRSSLVSSAA
jgi:hypothetical protein